MTLATMTDRTLPLATRVQAAYLAEWRMDDDAMRAFEELLADVAVADRLARAADAMARVDAMREPLSGWEPTPNGRYHVKTFEGWGMWATDEGYEVDVSSQSDGKATSRTSAQLAAEDASRAMVADMAKALGGSVTWATDESPSEYRLDCGDGSCVSPERVRGGMRTNGGCRCYKEDIARAHERMAARIRQAPSYERSERERAAATAAAAVSGGGDGA